MKKAILILSSICMALLPAIAFSADAENMDDAGKRMTTPERKEAMKALVEKKPNGDVVIRQNPKADPSLRKKAKRMPGYLMDLMLHIDPNMDFEKFNKIMVKHLGESGPRTGRGVVNACDEYLSTINMRLKPVKFQESNIRNRLDGGLPYFMILYSGDAYEDIAKRSSDRPESGGWTEWKKILRKTSKEKPARGQGITWALLRGYNRDTDEYFVQVASKNIWMTEDEIQSLLSRLYEPRF